MTIHDFLRKKEELQKITMVTCYDYWSASLLSETDVDCLLVGDSLAQVVHGFSSTISADTSLMALHTQAVARGTSKFIVADMPFLSVRKGLTAAMESVDQLMKAGAHAIKIEGIEGHEDIIQHIVQSGVPVMGHLGLTPQSVHALGGYKVQGRDKFTHDFIYKSALKLQELGCFSLVLECVPQSLASEIAKNTLIPVIGIGAGLNVDGQVLVLQDLLGLSLGHKPKFLKTFAQGTEFFKKGISDFIKEVEAKTYPSEKETYL